MYGTKAGPVGCGMVGGSGTRSTHPRATAKRYNPARTRYFFAQ